MACAEAVVIQRIRLQDAYLCQDCDCVGGSATQCECGSAALMSLSAVLNRSQQAFVPGCADAEEISAAGRECDVDAAAAPLADMVVDLGELFFGGADIPEELDERGLVAHEDERPDGRARVLEQAMDAPSALVELEVDEKTLWHKFKLNELWRGEQA